MKFLKYGKSYFMKCNGFSQEPIKHPLFVFPSPCLKIYPSHPSYHRAKRIQPAIDILVATVNLVNIINYARSFGRQGCN